MREYIIEDNGERTIWRLEVAGVGYRDRVEYKSGVVPEAVASPNIVRLIKAIIASPSIDQQTKDAMVAALKGES